MNLAVGVSGLESVVIKIFIGILWTYTLLIISKAFLDPIVAQIGQMGHVNAVTRQTEAHYTRDASINV